MKSFLSILGLIAVTLGAVSAISEEEKKTLIAALKPILEACEKEFGITKEELIAAKKAGNLDAIDPCFHACFFKKTGVMDDKGLFLPEVAVEKNKKYFTAEEEIAKHDAMVKVCTSVNDATVTDGDKGCDRAKLLLTCFMKEKANLTPFVNA